MSEKTGGMFHPPSPNTSCQLPLTLAKLESMTKVLANNGVSPDDDIWIATMSSSIVVGKVDFEKV